jgi:hypothetical protein
LARQCQVAGQGGFARRCHCAHDIGFNDHISRSAGHQQVLDIVAADQNQAPPRIDAGVIDDRESRLAATRTRRAQPSGAEAAQHPGGDADQCQDHEECDEEAQRKRFRHEIHTHFPSSPMARAGAQPANKSDGACSLSIRPAHRGLPNG